MVDIDKSERYQEPREHDCGAGLPSVAVLHRDRRREYAGQRLHERIPDADGGAALCAASTEYQVADDRHILHSGDGGFAVGACRAWTDEVEGWWRRGWRPVPRIGGRQVRVLLAPFALEHFWQTVNHHVEEASHEQPQHQAGAGEPRRRRG